MRLLFVCLGNICRSPTAEAVMRDLLTRKGLANDFVLDSAGTGHWHVGYPPDARSSTAALDRGVSLAGCARQVDATDFENFDLILAMDSTNRDDLLALTRDEQSRKKVHLLREFDPDAVAGADLDVPDPYYGSDDGFSEVFKIISRACEGLLLRCQTSRQSS